MQKQLALYTKRTDLVTLRVPFPVINWETYKYALSTGESLTSKNGLMGCAHTPPYKHQPDPNALADRSIVLSTAFCVFLHDMN